MNITRNRSQWFTTSLIVVTISLFSLFIFGFNLGLDFTGGSRWQVDFENPDIQRENLEDFLSQQAVLTKTPLIKSTEEGDFYITIQDISDEEISQISSEMEQELGAFEEKSFRRVDSSIGSHFKTKAFYAIMTALIGIILFVAFVFRKIPKSINPWRFGAVAIIALFHDILIILGVFIFLGALSGVELDLPFLTALLATLGFSVNDTIVILDRVRENTYQQKAHETFEDTIEKSIQETLRRSIFTSISTLLPLFSLLIFGADAIFYFVLALTLGIIVGTYSSIFLAAPLLVTWKDKLEK